MSSEIRIRPAYESEWESAMLLAWETFLAFEAPEYSSEGVSNFRDFVTDRTLKRMFLMGTYQLFVALDADRVVGLISVRGEHHISLLFVKEEYHRQGIGRKLIEYMSEYLFTELGQDCMTVNAAPYATEFYHKMGFFDTGAMTEMDGIRYTPMELIF